MQYATAHVKKVIPKWSRPDLYPPSSGIAMSEIEIYLQISYRGSSCQLGRELVGNCWAVIQAFPTGLSHDPRLSTVNPIIGFLEVNQVLYRRTDLALEVNTMPLTVA